MGKMPKAQSMMALMADEAKVESTAISVRHFTSAPAARVQNPSIGVHWKMVKIR